MINNPSIWGALRDKADNNVWDLVGTGAPTDGTSGTAVGLAGPGSTYTNITTGARSVNIGTLASPIWSDMGTVSDFAGLGSTGVAKMTYDFTVDGGATGLITPSNSPTIPAAAIILGGVVDATVTLSSTGAATISLGTSAGSSATSIKGATTFTAFTGITMTIIPVFTAATIFKMTAAGRPTLTVAGDTLLAGKFDLNLVYVLGNA